MKANVYQEVTDRIVEQLQKGIIPWQRPWSGAADGAISYATQKPYSWLNQMLLGMRSGEYLTFNQIKALGGNIKKGAKAGIVVFYTQEKRTREKRVVDETGEQEEVIVIEEYLIPVLRAYHVFHIEDCEGIESKCKRSPRQHNPIEEAEKVISNYVIRTGLKFQNDQPSGKAFYSPVEDKVVVPMLNQYEVVEEYYSTTFHELIHSTMKADRCNRVTESRLAAFGSESYSREELVAEIGSAMTCNVLGIDSEKAFRNSVAYIQGWIKHLMHDNKAIVWAASRAEKASKYITNQD